MVVAVVAAVVESWGEREAGVRGSALAKRASQTIACWCCCARSGGANKCDGDKSGRRWAISRHWERHSWLRS